MHDERAQKEANKQQLISRFQLHEFKGHKDKEHRKGNFHVKAEGPKYGQWEIQSVPICSITSTSKVLKPKCGHVHNLVKDS